jgi:hypothetical protein
VKLTVRGHLPIGVLRCFYVAGTIWRVSDFPGTSFATDRNQAVARNGSLWAATVAANLSHHALSRSSIMNGAVTITDEPHCKFSVMAANRASYSAGLMTAR